MIKLVNKSPNIKMIFSSKINQLMKSKILVNKIMKLVNKRRDIKYNF